MKILLSFILILYTSSASAQGWAGWLTKEKIKSEFSWDGSKPKKIKSILTEFTVNKNIKEEKDEDFPDYSPPLFKSKPVFILSTQQRRDRFIYLNMIKVEQLRQVRLPSNLMDNTGLFYRHETDINFAGSSLAQDFRNVEANKIAKYLKNRPQFRYHLPSLVPFAKSATFSERHKKR